MKTYYSKAVVLVLCACLLLAGRPLSAAGIITCEINAQSLDFGLYDLVNALDSSSNITVSCTLSGNGAAQADYVITLSVGGGSYSAREMSNGAGGILYYNLYSDAARAKVWGGDATSGVAGSLKITPSDPPTRSITHPVYGRIPGNQSSLAPGAYSSPAPIVVTMTY